MKIEYQESWWWNFIIVCKLKMKGNVTTGILAADESTGTMGKRLANCGLENTEDNRQLTISMIVHHWSSSIICIITRPRPAFDRLGLGGLSCVHFCGAQLGREISNLPSFCPSNFPTLQWHCRGCWVSPTEGRLCSQETGFSIGETYWHRQPPNDLHLNLPAKGFIWPPSKPNTHKSCLNCPGQQID